MIERQDGGGKHAQLISELSHAGAHGNKPHMSLSKTELSILNETSKPPVNKTHFSI